MKNLKKFLALALSASMVMGMTLTSMAAEPEVSVDAPIYIYDVTNVVVPTTFAVAFNPDQLSVTKGSETITDQIVSKNYGIINKSSKDKVITVTLKVEDLNGDKIKFVSDLSDPSVKADDYAVALKVVPANTDEVKIGTDSAALTTTGADLANVVMTPATDEERDLLAGENEVDFLLEKAKFSGSIDLDTQTGNNVNSAFTEEGLADNGKGITAFTFQGTMNSSANWSELTKGIKITAVYSNETAPDGATAVTGTGALFDYPNPVFKTGAEVGTIKYRKGTVEDDAVVSIDKVEMELNGALYDGYAAVSGAWDAASDTGNKISLSMDYINNFISASQNGITKEAIVTYTTNSGEIRTATVDVRLKKAASPVPVFKTGSGVGTIDYESGIGDNAVASISKVEISLNGSFYDGYNATDGAWGAATDKDGIITLTAEYMNNYSSALTDDTVEAVITYTTVGGDTKTATVNVKLR